jgi:hypothetical protein
VTRTLYGGSPADVLAQIDVQNGDYQPATGVLTVWDADTAGTQITDLTDLADDPIAGVIPDTYGRVLFKGPDGYAGPLWLEDADGQRWRLDPGDLTFRVQDLEAGGGGSIGYATTADPGLVQFGDYGDLLAGTSTTLIANIADLAAYVQAQAGAFGAAQIFTPTEFGAPCDGIGDDANGIQGAIDAAADYTTNVGRPAVVQLGRYHVVGAELVIPRGITVAGWGQYETSIRHAAGYTGWILNVHDCWRNGQKDITDDAFDPKASKAGVVLRDFQIYGDRTAVANGIRTTDTCDDMRMYNVEVCWLRGTLLQLGDPNPSTPTRMGPIRESQFFNLVLQGGGDGASVPCFLLTNAGDYPVNRTCTVSGASGGNVFTVSGTTMTTADIGRKVVIDGAGPAGTDLVTEITARTTTTFTTLASASGTVPAGTACTIYEISTGDGTNQIRFYGVHLSYNYGPAVVRNDHPVETMRRIYWFGLQLHGRARAATYYNTWDCFRIEGAVNTMEFYSVACNGAAPGYAIFRTTGGANDRAPTSIDWIYGSASNSGGPIFVFDKIQSFTINGMGFDGPTIRDPAGPTPQPFVWVPASSGLQRFRIDYDSNVAFNDPVRFKFDTANDFNKGSTSPAGTQLRGLQDVRWPTSPVDGQVLTYDAATDSLKLVTPASAGSTKVKLKPTADLAVSDTTLVSVPGMSTAVVNGKEYNVRGVIHYDGSTTGDVKVGFNGPVSSVLEGSMGGPNVGATSSSLGYRNAVITALGTANFGATGAGDKQAIAVQLRFVAGAGGTLSLRFAQNATDAGVPSTLFKESWLIVEEV